MAALLAAPADPPVYVGHPTNEIGHILELTRDAGYDELADLIAAEDYGRASAALAKMEKGLFPWRMTVTNGYQHGFLLYALKGYILEKSDDPPKAYRQYQNSRGCLDDDAAMMYYPQPRLEVLIGIGRTCNAVGRYTDSKDYLDVARIEGSEYADISAQADRALIRRGVEIGDYLEVTNLYNDLRWLTDLSREEYKEAAQILFWSHNDRAGFSMLLQGLTKLGIDNDLGVKDPMVDSFLNNIMRAEEQETSYFYDLLGYAIVDARALRGDEEYLAFLCKLRSVMSVVYPALSTADDFADVLKRIDSVKETLSATKEASVIDVHSRSDKGMLQGLRRLQTTTNGSSAILDLEVEMMHADRLVKRELWDSAHAAYSSLWSRLTDSTMGKMGYDGTTLLNAAAMGIRRTEIGLGKDECSDMGLADHSLRSAELSLLGEMENVNPMAQPSISESEVLPQAHPSMGRMLITVAHCALECDPPLVDLIAEVWSQTKKQCMPMPADVASCYVQAQVLQGNYGRAFHGILHILRTERDSERRAQWLSLSDAVWVWADDSGLEEYREILGPVVLSYLFLSTPHCKKKMPGRAMEDCLVHYTQEKTLRELSRSGQHAQVVKSQMELTPMVRQPGENTRLAESYASLGLTNRAVDCMLESLSQTQSLLSEYLLCIPLYGSSVDSFVQSHMCRMDLSQLRNYSSVTSRMRGIAKRQNREVVVNQLGQRLQDIDRYISNNQHDVAAFQP